MHGFRNTGDCLRLFSSGPQCHPASQMRPHLSLSLVKHLVDWILVHPPFLSYQIDLLARNVCRPMGGKFIMINHLLALAIKPTTPTK